LNRRPGQDSREVTVRETLLLGRWLSLFRVIVSRTAGCIGMMRVIGGWATPQVFTRAVGGIAASSPFGWYTASLGTLLLSVPGLFGPLVTFGMAAKAHDDLPEPRLVS
jgi:hypothetical protein